MTYQKDIRDFYNIWVRHNAKGRVLEIGKYKDHDYGFESIDIDPKTNPTHVGDCCDMPFGDNAFDVVLCNGMYEWVDDPQKMIYEACRVGKKILFGFVGKDYRPYKKPWNCFWYEETFPVIPKRINLGDYYHYILCEKL